MHTFKLNSTQIIISSFIMTILAGAIFLTMPIASKSGHHTDFITALFTSTSAMCVTGLVVVDTVKHWSFFGQLVILILIQMGGLGVILVASLISLFLGRKINLMQRTTLQEALSVRRVGGIVKLTEFIIHSVLIVELIGAMFLFIAFRKDFDFFTAVWYSIFHSVSAFCNAGFDLMGSKIDYISLVNYQSNVIVNIVIMLLIISGGLGFVVWSDIRYKKTNYKKYNLQTKLVLLTSLLLIIIPAIYFFFFEFNDFNIKNRVLASLFQSVTTRTAGFNTADFSAMSEVGKAISIILMLIGGSPGSTAGGMKTTTFIVLLVSTISIYKRTDEAHIFNRRIEIHIVRNAITIFMLYLTLHLLFSFVICTIENKHLIDSMFVTASALGTVGLSVENTSDLCLTSKVLLIILMYLGRVGGLSFIYAVIPSLNKRPGFISEEVTVG